MVSPKKAKSGRKKALVDEDEDDVARYEDDEEKEKEDEDRERDGGEDGDKAAGDGEKAAGDGEDAAEDEPVPETRIDVEVPKVSVEEVCLDFFLFWRKHLPFCFVFKLTHLILLRYRRISGRRSTS